MVFLVCQRIDLQMSKLMLCALYRDSDVLAAGIFAEFDFLRVRRFLIRQGVGQPDGKSRLVACNDCPAVFEHASHLLDVVGRHQR